MNLPDTPTPKEQASLRALSYEPGEPFPLTPLRLVKGLSLEGTVAERLVGALAEHRAHVAYVQQRHDRLVAESGAELGAAKHREQLAAIALEDYITRLAGEL